MIRLAGVSVVLALFASPATLRPQDSPTEVLILENARVWTGDSVVPEARGLVITNGRISRFLEDDAAPEFPEDVPVRRINAGGRRVVPGFNDAHTHFFDGGFALLSPDLLTSDTQEEFVGRLKAYAEGLPPGRWIDLPAAWDHERWPGHPLPSRQLIDSVTPRNPVWIRRPDGHVGLANTLALEAAGITADTPDPPGGRIDRDQAGEPTGILRDAGSLIRAAIPDITEEEYREALDAALAHAAEVGVTSVQDMCYDPGPVGIRLLEEYAREGRLTVRVYCRTRLGDWEEEADAGIRAGSGDAWVRRGSLKAFADGALGSSTAYMFEPYTDNPENRGLLDAVMQPPDSFFALAAGADRAGLQLSIHAIGDAAISLVLDQFERIIAENPAQDRRLRIEHAQHMAAGDFARMAEMDVIASVQPFHAIDDGRWAERKIGPERAKTTYAFRSFLDAGVTLAFGTDWPVAPLDPMRTVYAAVTRWTLDGEHPDGWVPEEKITVEEALRAYTRGSAYAEFAEQDKGRLVPGALADLVVLSEDPFEVPPERLEEIRPVLTMVGGRIVYEAEDWQVAGQPAGRESEVLATLERFFEAMTTSDVEGLSRLLHPQGVAFAARVEANGGAGRLSIRNNREIIAALAEGNGRWEERIWDPIVKVHPPIALVWAPYEFRVDGEFSHCGVDLFEMLHIDGEWKMTNASWTIENEGCGPGPPSRARPGEKDAVLAAVERMTTAMASRDVEAYAATLVPEGMTFRVQRVGPDGPGRLRVESNAEDIEKFSANGEVWTERLWDPTVLVHAPIAVVWVPYDFHVDGIFSHCGIDVFEMLQIDGEWKMTNASWTIEREGCEP